MADEFATNYVSLIQVLLLFYIFPIISIFTNTRSLIEDLENYLGFDFKILVLIPALVLLYFNHKKYKNIGNDKLKKNTFESPVFGLLMILLPLSLFISMLVIDHYLK